MASATVTHGKKKGLFRSLGSRRRRSHLVDNLAEKGKSMCLLDKYLSPALILASRLRYDLACRV